MPCVKPLSSGWLLLVFVLPVGFKKKKSPVSFVHSCGLCLLLLAFCTAIRVFLNTLSILCPIFSCFTKCVVYSPFLPVPSAAVEPSLVANAIIVPLAGGIALKPLAPPLPQERNGLSLQASNITIFVLSV